LSRLAFSATLVVVSGSEFRARLLHALMGATGISIVGSVALAGCGTTEERCFYWPEKAETVGCGPTDVTCGEVGGSACPGREEAKAQLFTCPESGTVETGPVRKGESCCYDVSVDDNTGAACPIPGRPFRDEATALLALREQRSDWQAPVSCDVRGLSPAQRSELAELWTKAALAEHASVASFQELVLDLLANAAPLELLRAAIAAAGDELEHARLCFSLAGAYGGAPVGPGPLRVPYTKPRTLAEVARRNAGDGCRNETLALLVLDEQRRRATEPAVRAVLDRLIEDELAHAVLSFRIAAWAFKVGGEEARRAAEEELARAPSAAARTDDDEHHLEGHGALSSGAQAKAVELGYREVLRPVLAALRHRSCAAGAPGGVG
jgi:hypothetical protein